MTHHWGDYFTRKATEVLDGKWQNDSTWGGLKSGMAALEGFGPEVPADVKEFVLAKQAEIEAGTLQPFAAPIKDNDGKVMMCSERGPVGFDLVQALAGDLGLRTATLDPIEGLTDATEGEDYLSLMRQNLDTLRKANGCR